MHQRRFQWTRNMLPNERRSHRITTNLEVPGQCLPRGLVHVLSYPCVALLCGLVCWKKRRTCRRVLAYCARVGSARLSRRTDPYENLESASKDTSELIIHYSTGVVGQPTSIRNPHNTTWKTVEVGDFKKPPAARRPISGQYRIKQQHHCTSAVRNRS